MEFNIGDKIEVVSVDKIEQGELLWANGDIVEVRDVEDERIEVWDKDKFLSEYIYLHELIGIKQLTDD